MESQLLTAITYLISYHLLDPFPSPFPPPFPTCASSVNYMHSNTYLRAALRIIQPKMSPKSFDTHFLYEKNRYFLKKWPISLGYIASLSLQFKTIFSPTELVISSSHKWPWYMVMPIRCRVHRKCRLLWQDVYCLSERHTHSARKHPSAAL